MPNERRSVRSIKTMGGLVDSRRTRSAAGALLELSAMANEKMLLQKELERWQRRHKEIHTRLVEIATKEQRLMAIVHGPGEGMAQAAPNLAVESSLSRRVKVKEFTY